MPYPASGPATWLVTGTSRSLGLELVIQLLQRGDNVAATTRQTPRHQLLGSDARELARAKIVSLASDIGAGWELAVTTDIKQSA